MKRILNTLTLLLFAVSVNAQIAVYKPYRTNGSYMVGDSALYIGKLKIASWSTFSLGGYADKAGQGFGLNYITNRLQVRGASSTTLDFPSYTEVVSLIASSGMATNLALGSLTPTTIPITNSNGTGFTIPAAVAGVSAGAFGSGDKTKLDAITGTNTGDQTISKTGAGTINLSGTGGSVAIQSISRATTGFEDANTVQTSPGLYVASNSSSATNYPSASNGMQVNVLRASSDALGGIQFWWDTSSSNSIYFRKGSGTSTFNTWDIVEGRNRAAGLYAPLISPTFTGTAVLPSTTSIGTVSSTEIGYLDNVTSAIQTQINAKGSGTVTSFGKTDGYGITSSVANSTTTPVHTISADTTSSGALVGKPRLAAALVLKANASSFSSGRYTPTVTDDGNVTLSTPYSEHYQKNGTEVTMSGSVEVTPTGAGPVVVYLTLPSGLTSNFTDIRDIGGIVTGNQASSNPTLFADVTGDKIKISLTAIGVTPIVVNFSLMYELK